MTDQEIADGLWGWERTRIVEIAKLKNPPGSIDGVPAWTVTLNLVRPISYVNETLGTAELSWEATDLGKRVAALVGE